MTRQESSPQQHALKGISALMVLQGGMNILVLQEHLVMKPVLPVSRIAWPVSPGCTVVILGSLNHQGFVILGTTVLEGHLLQTQRMGSLVTYVTQVNFAPRVPL